MCGRGVMAMSFLSHPDRKLQEQWLRSAKASPISRKATGSHGAAFSEYAVAPAERVVPIPIGVTFEQAAAALLQGMTAHYLSHSAYPIQPGDEVLIHAGAGGTGLPPLDLMKLASLGSLYVTRPILRDYTLTRAELLDRAAAVFQAVVSGTLKLRMECTYSLGEAAQAHRDLESRKTTGKLLLLP